MAKKYKLVSLFSGAGGLDLGFVLTGKYEIVLANDILSSAVETYAYNFKVRKVAEKYTSSDLPAVVLGDVAKLDFSQLKGFDTDIVIGGPPCQDFSIVRGPSTERRGIRVKRGRLYAHFIRALINLQPKLFVFENVPGLKSANEGIAYKVILKDFADLSVRWDEVRKVIKMDNNKHRSIRGYEILFSDIINFSKLGVPQTRQRLIIIGIRKDLASSKGLIWLWQVRSKIRKTLSDGSRLISKYPLTSMEVFEGKTLPDLQDKYVEIMKEYDGIWEEVGTKKAWEWKRKVWDRLTFDIIEDYLFVNRISKHTREELESAFDEHAKLLKEMRYYGVRVSSVNPPDKSNIMRKEAKAVVERLKRIPPDENHEFVRGTVWEVEGRGMSLIYRRLHPLKPSYTVVAYGGGGTWGYHYERSRGVLTNRERARLQTFPDTFLFKGTRSQVRAQIGEAVPPLVAKRIASVLVEVLDDL